MDKIKLNIIAGVEYHGKLYVSTREVNGLFSLDLSTMEIVYLKRFSAEEEVRELYRNAFLYKNEAWFIPGRGQHIAIVNLETLNIEYREFSFRKKNQELIFQKRGPYSSVYSSGGIIANKFLYLLPLNVDAVLIADMESKEFYSYYGIAEMDRRMLKGAYADGNLYLLPEIGNNLIVVNLKTKEKKNCKIEELNITDTYAGIAYYNNSLWIAPRNGKWILKFDLNIRGVEMIRFDEECKQQGSYHEIVVDGNELYFLPRRSDEILRFNMDNKQLTRIKVDGWIGRGGLSLWKLVISEKTITFYFARKSMLLIYDKCEGTLKKFKVEIEREILCKQNDFTLIKYQCNGCYEEDVLRIQEFIEIILGDRFKKGNICRNTGKEIWNTTKI